MRQSKVLIFFLEIIFLCCMVACNDKPNESFPYVQVNLTLDATDLNSIGVGMVVTITRDSTDEYSSIIDFHNNTIKKRRLAQRVYGNGIIIYHKDFNYYEAYDLTCTYKPREEFCPLSLVEWVTLPTCPCCGSIFNLESEGVPSTGGRAITPLKRYNATYIVSRSELVISN